MLLLPCCHIRPASLPASALDNLQSKAHAARFVHMASTMAGLPSDGAAAEQAEEAEAMAAAVAAVDGDDDSSPFEDSCIGSFIGRMASIAGRSFTNKQPLGLDRVASAVLAANLQSALSLAGVESCLELRQRSSLGAKAFRGCLSADSVANLTRELGNLSRVAEPEDEETLQALVDETLEA